MTASGMVGTTAKLITTLLLAAFVVAGCAGELADDGRDDGPRATATTGTPTPSAPTSTTARDATAQTTSATQSAAADAADAGASAATTRTLPPQRATPEPAKDVGVWLPPESGGTRNPNNRPLPLVYFEDHGVNPFVDADEDPLSTFALDGDTASYGILELYLGESALPPPAAVRVEEYVNSFPQNYPTAAGALGLHLDAGPSPFGPEGYLLLRVGVSNPAPTTARDPVSLIFVIDTSGSMGLDNRLRLAKVIVEGVADRMIRGDRAALVTYGNVATTISGFVDFGERSTIVGAAQDLHPGGSTFAEAGLRMAYGLADGELDAGRAVRLVLISDGVANVGETGPEQILDVVDQRAQRQATLTAIGVGISGNYNDVLMEALANRGNGTYHYVIDRAAAERYLEESAAGVFTETARDARIQVAFNPDAVRKYRLIGYENRAVADEDFEDDSLDFGEPGFARDVTALYELRLMDGASPADEIASARLRWRDPASGETTETSAAISLGDAARSLGETSPYFRRAAAVAEFAELLRMSFWAQCGSMSDVSDLLRGVGEELGDDPDHVELVRRVAHASEYFEPHCAP